MRATVFLINECPAGRLAIMPRPRGGEWLEGEALSWRSQGLDTIVSLLTDDEIAELELTEEQTACAAAGLSFIRFPIADRGVPPETDLLATLGVALAADLQAGRGIGIHCRMGIGRSACVAACVLAVAGLPLEDAWPALHRARGMAVPDTPEQRAWVENWCASRRLRDNHQPGTP
jgi:protein-tyrosine phosphatase